MKKNSEFVGVDEKFIPENEKYVDESLLGDKEKAKRTIKNIGIGYLCFIVVFAVIFICIAIFIISNFFSKDDGFMSKFPNIFSEVQSLVVNQENENFKKTFNKKFESKSGTKLASDIINLLDDVVTNNKKNSDKIITVMYNENITNDPNEIVDLKKYFRDGDSYQFLFNQDIEGYINQLNKSYEVMLDYDTNGFVNKITIKDI